MRDKKIVQKTLLVSLILTLSAMTASAQNNRLKVMTWNITGGECGREKPDMRPYAAQIKARDPDVIAVQEIHFGQAYRLAQYLNPNKPYQVRFVRAKKCWDSNLSGIHDFGNAILSRYPITWEGGLFDSGFEVSPDPDALKRGEHIKVAAASVQLPTPDGKSPNGPWVRIYSAHLTGNNGKLPHGPKNATTQVIDTLVHIAAWDVKLPGQIRAILLGDFNAFPSVGPCYYIKSEGYEPYKWLTTNYAGFQFIDAWLVKPPGGSDNCGFTLSAIEKPEPMVRYDYIFLRNAGNYTVTKMEVVKSQQPRLSGHFPVYAELSF